MKKRKTRGFSSACFVPVLMNMPPHHTVYETNGGWTRVCPKLFGSGTKSLAPNDASSEEYQKSGVFSQSRARRVRLEEGRLFSNVASIVLSSNSVSGSPRRRRVCLRNCGRCIIRGRQLPSLNESRLRTR